MIFNERYKDVLRKKEFFEKEYGDDFCIENNIIDKVDVVVTGHFGNCVSLNILCENICPIPLYNSTHNIGFILRALIEMFDKEDDNSVSISELRNTPIRLVYDSKSPWGSKPVAIGHFIKDRFILIEDLMRLEG